MTTLAILKGTLPPDKRVEVVGPVILGEPAIYVDDDGNEWEVFDSPYITPEMVGRAAAIGQGRAFKEPPPNVPGDVDPFERMIEAQGQQGRRPTNIQVGLSKLKPKGETA